MVQGIEKRGAPRVEAPRVLLRIATLERLRTHFLKDLSEGGAFIRIAKPFSAGTTLTVELTCPGLDRPLRLSARVVRSVEASASAGDVGMAVRFEDADEQAKLKLRELVEKHLADDASQGGEVARLGAQVQTLIMELGASREALVASEKKAIEAAQRETAAQRELSEARLKGSQEAPLLRPTPLPFAVPADAGRIEVRRLRAELEEAGRRIASLEERHLSLETSEGTARQLLEKLAAERTRQKKQQAIDQARHATELAQLQAELESETARTQLERSGAEQAVQSAQEELARARKLFEFALK